MQMYDLWVSQAQATLGLFLVHSHNAEMCKLSGYPTATRALERFIPEVTVRIEYVAFSKATKSVLLT
jgi:hypothetical protein